MMEIILLLLKHWKIGIGIGLIAYAGWLKFITVPNLEQQVLEEQAKYSELQIAHELCEQGRAELKQAIDVMNEKVESWQQLSNKLSAENEQLKADLQRQEQETEQLVTDILNRPTPKSCDEAIQFLKDRRDLKW